MSRRPATGNRGVSVRLRRVLLILGLLALLAPVGAAPSWARGDASCPPSVGNFDLSTSGTRDKPGKFGVRSMYCNYVDPEGNSGGGIDVVWIDASFPDPSPYPLVNACTEPTPDPHRRFVTSASRDAYAVSQTSAYFHVETSMFTAAGDLLSRIEPLARLCPVAARASASSSARSAPASEPSVLTTAVDVGGATTTVDDDVDPTALALAVGLLFALLGVGAALDAIAKSPPSRRS